MNVRLIFVAVLAIGFGVACGPAGTEQAAEADTLSPVSAAEAMAEVAGEEAEAIVDEAEAMVDDAMESMGEEEIEDSD